jgi:hypothetical protein
MNISSVTYLIHHELSLVGPHQNQGSHVVANYLGSTHDINPWNITMEPGDVNQSRRTCTLEWAEEVAARRVGVAPSDWVAKGERWPALPCPEMKGVEFCLHVGLHIPQCRAHLGRIPKAISELAHGRDASLTAAAKVATQARMARKAKETKRPAKKAPSKKEKAQVSMKKPRK